MVERNVGKADWTLNEEAPSFDEFTLGMIPIDELKPELQRERRVTPPPTDIPFDQKFDHTDNANWWMNKKKKPANTDALDAWVENQSKRGSGMRAFVITIIMLAIILTIGSFMVAQAHAGMAIMKFTVVELTDETVTVEDSHGDSFTFYREGTIPVVVGQEVSVITDFTYKGEGLWAWHSKLTAIIE